MTDFPCLEKPEFPAVEILDEILIKPVSALSLVELEPWYCVLEFTATSAELVLPWPSMRTLLAVLFSLTQTELAVSKRLVLPDQDNEVSELAVTACVSAWKQPPFTLQRLCELIWEQLAPATVLRTYTSPLAFLFAVSKCTLGVTDTQHRSPASAQPTINPDDFVYFDRDYRRVLLAPEDTAAIKAVDRVAIMRVKGTGPLLPRHAAATATTQYPRGDHSSDDEESESNPSSINDANDDLLGQSEDTTETPTLISSLEMVASIASDTTHDDDDDLFSPTP